MTCKAHIPPIFHMCAKGCSYNRSSHTTPTPFSCLFSDLPSSAVIFVALLLLPMPRLLVKYTAISLSILPLFTVFITNMKPVRDYLRQHDHGSRRDLPTLLWRRLTGGESPGAHSIISLGRVACTTSHEDHKSLASIRSGIGSTAKGHLHETPLAAVMGFLPVQQAFGEYCRKALCSEVKNATNF